MGMMLPTSTTRSALLTLSIVVAAGLVRAEQEPSVVDLLAGGAASFRPFDSSRWTFVDQELRGATPLLNGPKTSPESSAFLVSKRVFEGDITVAIDITFETGRYLGVYVDFDQETQSGIWMATGHVLAEDPAERHLEVETAYIKTVERSDWTVRTQGELLIEPGERVRMKFTKRGDTYRVWRDDRLIVTYQKDGGYPPGPLQLRLTNAAARIHRLDVETRRPESDP